MAFTSLTKLTDNYIKIKDYQESVVYIPVFLSKYKQEYLIKEIIQLHEPIIKIINLEVKLSSINFKYNQGFIYLDSKFSYQGTYVNKENIAKNLSGEINYSDIIDSGSIISSNFPQSPLDFDYKYNLSYTFNIKFQQQVELLIIFSLKLSIYRYQNLLIKVYNK